MEKYQRLLQKLYEINHTTGMKLDLQNVTALDRHRGKAASKLPSVHIAGSNGKGSVATKIAYALQLAGKKTGLYTSPHIANLRERIQIDGKMIPITAVSHHLTEIFSASAHLGIEPTFFECVTLLAFEWFAAESVDSAVIEVGLGGRLDATNIISPTLTVITSICLEHTNILGTSLEAIAQEKGGIIKPAIPVVIGPRVPIEPIAAIAKRNNAPLHIVSGHFASYDEENNAVAQAAMALLQIPQGIIEQAIKRRPPCRFEVIPPKRAVWPAALILDVAHNPGGLHRTLSEVAWRYPDKAIWVIWGLSRDKDVGSCCKEVAGSAAKVWCLQGNNERSLEAASLKEQLIAAGAQSAAVFAADSATAALEDLWRQPGVESAVVCVCGSFFHMAELRRALQIPQELDPFPLQESKLSTSSS